MTLKDLKRIATILECEAVRLELLRDERAIDSMVEFLELATQLRAHCAGEEAKHVDTGS